jgi:hypothetical protein
MLSTKVKSIRKTGRNLLGLGFWVHAFYATKLFQLPEKLIPHPPPYELTILLIATIFYYSLLGEFEWLAIAGDALYVYLWPCIIAYKTAWGLIKAAYRFIRPRIVFRSPGLISQPLAPRPPIAVKEPAKAEEKKEETRSALGWAIKPFTEFTFLWALIALASHYKPLVGLSLLIAFWGAGASIYSLWNFLSDTSLWIEKLKGNFASQIANYIGQVLAWQEISNFEEITKAANALKMLEAIFAFIAENKAFLSKITTALAVFISVIFYFYISFLSSCIYIALAKLQGIPWVWGEAFVTALYIPFAYTNLPKNVPILLTGGLQAIAFTLIGWNIFIRHLNTRFERIALAASELRGSFEDNILRVKLRSIQEEAAKIASAVAPLPGTIDAISANSRDPVVETSAPSRPRNGFRQKPSKRRR